jgi:hypothetical protein
LQSCLSFYVVDIFLGTVVGHLLCVKKNESGGREIIDRGENKADIYREDMIPD